MKIADYIHGPTYFRSSRKLAETTFAARLRDACDFLELSLLCSGFATSLRCSMAEANNHASSESYRL